MASAVLPLLEAPMAIPGYRLEELVARQPGLWAQYRAVRLSGGRPVSVTLLGSRLNHDRAYRERFLRDAPRLTGLDHPAMVRVLAAGRAERGLFVVAEPVDATTLHEALGVGTLDPERALGLLAPIAELLELAHRRKLIHGEVSAETVLVTPGGHAKLAGFGLATRVEAARVSGAATFPAMAPELRQGHRPTPATDVYGLSATLYGCLTGREPTPAAAAATGGSPATSAMTPDLEAVLERGLAEDPSARQPSPREFIDAALEAVFGDREGHVAVLPKAVAAPAGSTPPAGSPGVLTLKEESRRARRPRRPRRAHEHRPATAPAAPTAAVLTAPPVLAGVEAVRRRRLLLAVLATAAIAATAGSLLAARDTDPSVVASPRGPASLLASTSQLSLTIPSTWSLAEDPVGVPGLPLDESVQLGPKRPAAAEEDETGLAAGLVEDVDRRLLPPGFDARVTAAPVAEPVRVGRYAGYRYAGLVLRGSGRRLDLYAVPTTQGAVTIACVQGPGGPPEFLRRCEGVATTLTLDDDLRAESLGPSPQYLAALNANVERLDARRRAGRAALRAARTPAGQARLADDLARAYSRAAEAQARAPRGLATAGINDDLVQTLRDVRDAYAAAADAARAGDRAGYNAARGAVQRRERRLRDSLEDLDAPGDYAAG